MKKNILNIIVGVIILVIGIFAGLNLRNISSSFERLGLMGMIQSKTVQNNKGYSVQITSLTSNVQPDQESIITYKIVDVQGKTLKNFAVNHEKLMHLLIVRSDLQNYQHLHPEFNKESGEFTIPVIFPDNGTYRLFADFVPEVGQMGSDGHNLGVTSFQDIKIGDNNQTRLLPVIPDTQTTKIIGDYELTYTINQPLSAGSQASILIGVKKNGVPVTDIENYLGARSHGILLKKDTLDFAHLHAMSMETHHMMEGHEPATHSSGNEIHFQYIIPDSGIYKLFTQFQHQGQIITSDYTLSIK